MRPMFLFLSLATVAAITVGCGKKDAFGTTARDRELNPPPKPSEEFQASGFGPATLEQIQGQWWGERRNGDRVSLAIHRIREHDTFLLVANHNPSFTLTGEWKIRDDGTVSIGANGIGKMQADGSLRAFVTYQPYDDTRLDWEIVDTVFMKGSSSQSSSITVHGLKQEQ